MPHLAEAKEADWQPKSRGDMLRQTWAELAAQILKGQVVRVVPDPKETPRALKRQITQFMKDTHGVQPQYQDREDGSFLVRLPKKGQEESKEEA